MDQKELMRQMLKFNKTTFDNTFTAMVLMQEQMDRMVKMFLDQATWVPKEGKQAITDWVKTYKKGGEDLKKSMDEGFKKLDEYLV